MSNALPTTIESYLGNIDIHDLKREKITGVIPFILISGLLLALECFNVYWLVNDLISPLIAFLIHLIAVAIGSAYALFRISRDVDARFAMFLAITVALLGPFGAGGSMLCILMTLFYARNSQDFSEWFSSIFPARVIRLSEEINDNLISGRDESSGSYSVIPFMDVMAVGSESQKREALSKMTSMFHPTFAPSIKKALTDSSNAIRVQAATAVTRIENAFLEKSLKINHIAEIRTRDPEIKLIQARHYDDYAYTGVLDPEREETNRVKALEYYREYLHMKPDDSNVRLYIGRLLKRSGYITEAADWLKKCLDEGFVTDGIVTWYMECLYALGKYAELRNICSVYYSKLSQGDKYNPAFVESIKLWAGDTVTHQTPPPLAITGGNP